MASVTFDPATKYVVVTTAPDVDDRVALDIQQDVYSAGKDAWESDASLNKYRFPFEAVGGRVISAGRLTTTYLFLYGWRIQPYDAAHELQITGNVFTDDGSPLIVPTTSSAAVATQLIGSAVTGVDVPEGNAPTAIQNAAAVWSADLSGYPDDDAGGVVSRALRFAKLAFQIGAAK